MATDQSTSTCHKPPSYFRSDSEPGNMLAETESNHLQCVVLEESGTEFSGKVAVTSYSFLKSTKERGGVTNYGAIPQIPDDYEEENGSRTKESGSFREHTNPSESEAGSQGGQAHGRIASRDRRAQNTTT